MRRAAVEPVLRSDLRMGMGRRKYEDDRPSFLRAVCHGDPDRCLWYRSRPLPLCARCTGFYIGLLIGTPWGAAMAYLGMSSLIMLLIFVLTSAPLAADGLSQYLGWRRSRNSLRLITGLASGFGGGMGASYMFFRILGIL